MKSEFYTVKELAEALSIAPLTVYRMVDRGELKEGDDFYKIGRSYRFDKARMDERFKLRG